LRDVMMGRTKSKTGWRIAHLKQFWTAKRKETHTTILQEESDWGNKGNENENSSKVCFQCQLFCSGCYSTMISFCWLLAVCAVVLCKTSVLFNLFLDLCSFCA
jgi:hypothetical protein